MLYNDLLKLTEQENSPFYFTDHQHKSDNHTYRIFNYRLASMTDFQQKNALWCRGTMFRLENGSPVLVSRPIKKFFNLHEGWNEDVNLDDIRSIHTKLDGSLIRSYLDFNDNICFATKGSLYSEQAVAAQKYMQENNSISESLYEVLKNGITRCWEYTSPSNHIVVNYSVERMTHLADVDNECGQISDSVITLYPDDVIYNDYDSHKDFVLSVPQMKHDMEGFVVRMNNGDHFKIKTDRYCRLHKLKDSVNNPNTLWDIILAEEADDLVAAFHDDEIVINMIREMENMILPEYRKWISFCDLFCEKNKELNQKDFAMAAKDFPLHFSNIMSNRNNKDFDSVKMFTKNYRELLLSS